MWYAYLAYFFAGNFLANGVPHFVHGISGEPFQSPFASPPAVGLSSPLVNVLWGLANFGIGYLLVVWLRPRIKSRRLGLQLIFAGVLVTSVALSIYFEGVRGR
jgi:hypothetical protein